MDDRSTRSSPSRTRQRHSWVRLPDEQLLQLRFCDLQLKLPGSALERRLQHIYDELQRRGIGFRPHMWLAEEWFSPDGIPGIAVPFYLAHPRLIQLERHQMKQVEGGNANWLRRILRHEAGHAIDTAYRLRYRRAWREVFGPPGKPYPDSYQVRPASRRYVHHLGDWYAQSHPTEDFAETFAVWLKPKSDWRHSYAGWPAYDKLLFVDELMQSLRDVPPLVRSRAHVEPLCDNRSSLADHYAAKVARYGQFPPSDADALLRRVFTCRPAREAAPRASALLRECRSRVATAVALEAGVDRYTVHQVLRRAIGRCDELQLRARGARRTGMRDARTMLVKLVGLLAANRVTSIKL